MKECGWDASFTKVAPNYRRSDKRERRKRRQRVESCGGETGRDETGRNDDAGCQPPPSTGLSDGVCKRVVIPSVRG
jgi:hypothetical protein